jgi:hypothetical protein
MNTGNLIALSVGLFFPALAAAQVASQQNPEAKWITRPKFEMVASIASGHVYRFDDQGFGNHVNCAWVNRHRCPIVPRLLGLDRPSDLDRYKLRSG